MPTPPYRILQTEDGRIVDQIDTVATITKAHDLQASDPERIILDHHDEQIPPRRHITRSAWAALSRDYRTGDPRQGTAQALMLEPDGATALVPVHVTDR